jgi:hypothetical protein
MLRGERDFEAKKLHVDHDLFEEFIIFNQSKLSLQEISHGRQ